MSIREKEIEYLGYICSLHLEQKSGNNKDTKFARISEGDYKKFLSIKESLENSKDILVSKDDYEKGCTQLEGLPVSAQCSPLYLELTNHIPTTLPKHVYTWAENFISFIDFTKRGTTDLAEDTVSTLRMAGILATLSELGTRMIIGLLNLINVVFEFGKALRDLYLAFISDDEFRTEHMIEATSRVAFALLGTITCLLYLCGAILLPFALLAVSAVTLPIFVATLIKDTYLYFKAKEMKEESCKDSFITEYNVLYAKENKTPAEVYQLGTMERRLKDEKFNDKQAFLDAEREMSFAAVETISYLFIATGSALSLAIFIIQPFLLSHPKPLWQLLL